jgi:chromosome segregation ATPase
VTWDLAVQLIVALGGLTALVGLLKVRADKKKILAEAGKTGADASAVVAQTAISLLGPYTEQVSVLQSRMADANRQIDEFTTRLRQAQHRITELELQVELLSRELELFRGGGHERTQPNAGL